MRHLVIYEGFAYNLRMRLQIIAPSFKIPTQDFKKTMSLLEKAQVDFKFHPPLFEKGYLCSASHEKRWQDVKKAFKDKHSDTIWCLRGGYGCLHLLPRLEKLQLNKVSSRLQKAPLKIPDQIENFKLLIGFSDITILHYWLNQVWNWPSLHYRHINSFITDESVDNGLKDFSKTCQNLAYAKSFRHSALKPKNLAAQNLTKIEGEIIGGNLISLQSMIGSKLPKPGKKILFLEEVEEPVYKIDRALSQLQQTGWMLGLKAIVLGSFTHSNAKVQRHIAQHLKSFFYDSSIPVFGNLACGHLKKQKPLFFATPSRIEKLKDEKFQLENSVVRLSSLHLPKVGKGG